MADAGQQQQPNFPAITAAIHNITASMETLEQEAPLLANVPGVQGHQAILNALNNLGQQLGNRINALENRFVFAKR
jgi:hypothetical protein